jgi:ABC-type branched-subunit amino acid transport system substrate-binding protein
VGIVAASFPSPIPVLSFSASAAELSNKVLYPSFFRVIPSDNLQARAVVALLAAAGFKRVAIVFQNDPWGDGLGKSIKAECDLLDKKLSIAIPVSVSIEVSSNGAASSARSVNDALVAIKASGIRVIIVVVLGIDVKNFFDSAAVVGVKSPEYQFIGVDGVTGSVSTLPLNTTAAIRGLITVAPDSLSSVPDKWWSQWKDALSLPGLPPEMVSRINPALLSKSTTSPMVPLVYDAVMAFAVAASMAKTQNTTLLKALRSPDLKFAGITGAVAFDQFQDRRGLNYAVSNLAGEGSALSPISSWTNDTVAGDPKLIDGTLWSGGLTKPPPDVFTATLAVSNRQIIALACVGGVLVLLYIAQIALLWAGRSAPVIKRSSPEFLSITLVGSAVFTLATILWGLDPNSTLRCTSRIWVTAIGFSMLFSPLLARVHRVHVIFNLAKSANHKGVRSSDLLALVLIVIVVDVVYLTLWTSVHPLRPEVILFKDAARPVYWLTHSCTGKAMFLWAGVLAATKGFVVVYGAYLAWATRSVQLKDFNESKLITIAIYNVLVIGFVAVPLIYTLNKSKPPNISAVFAIIFVLGNIIAFSTPGLVIFPKLVRVFVFKKKTFDNDDVTVAGATVRRGTSSMTVRDSVTSPNDIAVCRLSSPMIKMITPDDPGKVEGEEDTLQNLQKQQELMQRQQTRPPQQQAQVKAKQPTAAQKPTPTPAPAPAPTPAPTSAPTPTPPLTRAARPPGMPSLEPIDVDEDEVEVQVRGW